jgi:hypothetical protein
LWAPVQEECSLGTLSNNIDQTLLLDEVYVNSLEYSYTTGANATENYGAETDTKMWLLNDAKFVNFDSTTISGAETYLTLTIASGTNIATLSNGTDAASGFLRKDVDGQPAATWYDLSSSTVFNVPVEVGTTSASGVFVYHDTGTEHRLYFPIAGSTYKNYVIDHDAGNRVEAVYAADAYGTGTSNKYFDMLGSDDLSRPHFIGAVRQGQVEAYIVSSDDAAYNAAWRLTGVTISADLTREPLTELGHLGPYDRPLTLPIPITLTVDSTAGDLENWAKIAQKGVSFGAETLTDLNLADLMAVEDLKLVVMVYGQTDEEAGGTGANRTISTESGLVGKNWWYNGVINNDGSQSGVYVAGDTEYPLKTVIVEHLKLTDEGMTLDMGANATQTFGFRSTNDLYVVKGYLSVGHITNGYKVRRNA